MVAPRGPSTKHVWTWADLALVIGAILPSLLLAAVLVQGFRRVFPEPLKNRAAAGLTYQAAFYVFMLGMLYLVGALRHRQPFWKSLAWIFPFKGAWWCVAAGPVLMVVFSLLGQAMHTPIMPNPWEDLITGRGSQVAVLLFVAVLGPVWEELIFRGFLYGLLEEHIGPWGAIVGAAVPFGLIHGSQNKWQWQYIVIVALSGVLFGWARYRTGSTAASTLMHSAYNSSLFVVFTIQKL